MFAMMTGRRMVAGLLIAPGMNPKTVPFVPSHFLQFCDQSLGLGLFRRRRRLCIFFFRSSLPNVR
jgi:hypothetical protein